MSKSANAPEPQPLGDHEGPARPRNYAEAVMAGEQPFLKAWKAAEKDARRRQLPGKITNWVLLICAVIAAVAAVLALVLR